MRSFINTISIDLFVNDRRDRANVAGMLQVRIDILGALRFYATRALGMTAHLLRDKRKHHCAVLAVVTGKTTALGSSAGWRPGQPSTLPAFASSR